MAITTTTYGTWCNRVDPDSLTVEQTVTEAFGSEGYDGFDIDAIVREYRSAINDALPDSVTLSGDEFIGPYNDEDCHFDGYPTTETGALDIKEIVDGVDLWKIINRHGVA